MITQLRTMGGLATDIGLFSTQFSTYPLDWWLSRRIGLRSFLPRDLHVPRGTLVLANHRSMFDPFLVTYHLGSHNWYSSMPMRCPTTPVYARRPLLGSTIKLLGAYDIGEAPIERAKKLLYTRDLLSRNRTVLLFPEGRIVDHGHLVGEFQRGAEMLFAHDYPTLFVRLSGFSTESFIHPTRVNNPTITYSDVIRGDAREKIAYMEKFFSSPYDRDRA